MGELTFAKRLEKHMFEIKTVAARTRAAAAAARDYAKSRQKMMAREMAQVRLLALPGTTWPTVPKLHVGCAVQNRQIWCRKRLRSPNW